MALDCPIGYTCPDINQVLSEIVSTLQTAKAIKSIVEAIDVNKTSPEMWDNFIETIKAEVEEIEHYLATTDRTMENLRHANETLREWGLDANNKVEELETKIEELE